MHTVANAVRRALVWIYGVVILLAFWFYFVVPAPDRWHFVIKAIRKWPVLFHG